jgi:hypothetical protein
LYIIFHHDVNPVLIIFIREIHEHVLFACLPIYEWALFHSNGNGLLLDLIPFRVELAKPDHELFHPEVLSAVLRGELCFYSVEVTFEAETSQVGALIDGGIQALVRLILDLGEAERLLIICQQGQLG